MTDLKSEKPSNGFYGKRTIIFGLLILALAILSSLYLFNHISNLAEQELLELVNKELAPNAEIQIGDLTLRIFPVRIILQDVKLNHKEPFENQLTLKPLDNIRHFELNRAELRGLSIYQILFKKQWNIKSLSLDSLNFALLRTHDRALTDSTPLDAPPNITIGEITLSNSRFDIFSSRSADTPAYSLQNLHVWVHQFKINDPEKPLHTYFDDFRIEAGSLKHYTTDGFYEISIDGLFTDSSTKVLSFESFAVIPLLSPYQIASQIGYQTDVFKITGGPYNFSGLEINHWIEHGDIKLGYAELHKLSLEIERDKTYPRKPREDRLLPNRQFRDLSISVQADSISWKNGLMSYKELFQNDGRSGKILFTNIDLNLKHLQNRFPSDTITVQTTARFMESSDMFAEFHFFPSETGNHFVKARLSDMDFKEINNTLENLVFVRVNEGRLKSLEFSFSADDNYSDGSMIMIYDGLDLRFLDEKMEEGTRSRVRSFMANTFAIRSSNDAADPRTGTMDYERDKERSMFNFWWRSIQTGLMDTVKR